VVDWRQLWPVKGETFYVSMDEQERLMHCIEADAPIAKVASVYYKTLAKCRAMGPFEFDRYQTEWLAKGHELAARDREKAEAFLQAIADNGKERINALARKEQADLVYLYDEQEQPHAASGD